MIIDPDCPERRPLGQPDARPDPLRRAKTVSAISNWVGRESGTHNLARFPELNHVDDLFTETPWES